ncbi:hypothetical protein [Acuticoccus sp.]|uniref:hypothetical protein n=1 Tax=Acuticoccus sp. TaxID=1904378 RepID=UPI003B51DAE2
MADAMPSDDARDLNIVERLFAALSKQLSKIETDSSSEGDDVGERAKVIGLIAKTFETLIGVRSKVAAPDAKSSLDVDQIRRDLAERLAKLSASACGVEPKAAG